MPYISWGKVSTTRCRIAAQKEVTVFELYTKDGVEYTRFWRARNLSRLEVRDGRETWVDGIKLTNEFSFVGVGYDMDDLKDRRRAITQAKRCGYLYHCGFYKSHVWYTQKAIWHKVKLGWAAYQYPESENKGDTMVIYDSKELGVLYLYEEATRNEYNNIDNKRQIKIVGK
jgi:hypothetical protein